MEEGRVVAAERALLHHWMMGLAKWLVIGCTLTFAGACSCGDEDSPGIAFECQNASDCGGGTCASNGQCACPDGTDEGCPSGAYCNSNLCWQDCTPGGNECAQGQTCTSEGRCIADPNGTDSAKPQVDGSARDSSAMGEDCPRIIVDLDNQTPTVMLLIDRSGSMNTNDFGPQNQDRWEAMTEAVVGASGIVSTEQSEVIFGAAIYDDGSGCPALETVDPALNNLGAVQGLMDEGVRGGTPTGESVDAYVNSFDLSEGAPVLVLATDGAPDYCANSQANDPVCPGGGNNCDNSEKAIDQAELEKAMQMSRDAVKRAYDKGVRTFVLGVAGNSSDDDAISPQVFRDHLDELARIGAGQDQNSGAASAFSATNPQELAAAFSTIVGTVRSCSFDIDGKVDLARAGEGTVTLNGTPLTHNTDWRLNSETTMELLGDACETFKTDNAPILDANFPCGTVIPIR